MSLPTPNLDDRSFKDIVNEAIKLIPKYCPQWTDFNPSDPGITLIELMAWMTEMIIYRLNRVPEKNYIKFLELMGVTLRPPQPARAWVTFKISDGAKEENLPLIPAGTRISTGELKGKSIVFETVDSLNLTASRIIKICSKYMEQYTDHSPCLTKETTEGVPIFFGDRSVPHIFYLGDPRIGTIGKETLIKVYITLSSESPSGLNIEWECWDGKIWIILIPSSDETFGLRKSGEITFTSLPKMEETEINGTRAFWLRARLIGRIGEKLPQIVSFKRGFEPRPGYGIILDNGYLSIETFPFSAIDFSRDLYPFGKEPKQNNTIYLSSDIFSRREVKVIINITLSELYFPLSIESLKELEVHWEYYSETGNWKLLGITAATGVTKSEHDFKDETQAFTHSGTISYSTPEDAGLFLIQGKNNFWIRASIRKGNYGLEKISFPIIKSLLVNFKENPRDFQYSFSYNYFSYKDLIPLIKAQKPIEPFEILFEKDPSFYLAFDSPFSNKLHSLYFRFVNNEKNSLSKIIWEYFSKEGWRELRLFKDSTLAFSQNGAIEFIGPASWEKSVMFEKEGYWLRARCEGDTYNRSPLLVGLHSNAVEVIQAVSIRNEILGSGNGQQYQTFGFSNSPILPNPRMLVKEIEHPSTEEVSKYKEMLKGDVVEEIDLKTSEVIALWMRWREVENFFNSRMEDRHYTLDPFRAIITFGDGKRGKIPPVGRGNIKCEVYYIGGGARGNVGKKAISFLETTYPFIEEIGNPDQANGGCDAESTKEAQLRGPWVLKHRFRAVTVEDFEKLALEASGEVAKARCFEEGGELKLLIVPKGESEKLQPGNMLIQKVKNYLDERRLITTRLNVEGPKYIDILLEAEIVLLPQKVEIIPQLKIKIAEKLKEFFHPLKGGPAGEGWPMGRDIHISEIYYVLENFEEVDYVKKVMINKALWTKKIEIGNIEFPYLKEINITIETE